MVFGEGVPAPLPAESLIRFCSIYSPLASWCFPSASRTWFPFEQKEVFLKCKICEVLQPFRKGRKPLAHVGCEELGV